MGIFSVFFWTYESGMVDIDLTMACDISIYCVFFSTKTMGVMKIHFGHHVGKFDPWYWITPYLLCRDRPAAARRCACFFIDQTSQTVNSVFWEEVEPKHSFSYKNSVNEISNQKKNDFVLKISHFSFREKSLSLSSKFL